MNDASYYMWRRQLAERRETGTYWTERDPAEDADDARLASMLGDGPLDASREPSITVGTR